MSTLIPEAPPADILVIVALIVLLAVLAAALIAVMFGKSASERLEDSAEEDMAEQEFALSRPGALGGYRPIHPLHTGHAGRPILADTQGLNHGKDFQD